MCYNRSTEKGKTKKTRSEKQRLYRSVVYFYRERMTRLRARVPILTCIANKVTSPAATAARTERRENRFVRVTVPNRRGGCIRRESVCVCVRAVRAWARWTVRGLEMSFKCNFPGIRFFG